MEKYPINSVPLTRPYQLDQLSQARPLTIHQDAEAIDAPRDERAGEDGDDHQRNRECDLPPAYSARRNTHEHSRGRPERNVRNHFKPRRIGGIDTKEARDVTDY